MSKNQKRALGRNSEKNHYIAQIWPSACKAYLKLHHDKGESAQVDWGMFGTIRTGQTMRKLHFFTMVLGYSRMLFVQFTVLERMEQFLECIRLGFNAFGGVPRKLVIDNLKTVCCPIRAACLRYFIRGLWKWASIMDSSR
ncbi:MAG: transposase [Spartobacteria bacterium]|nr:transposase [Spartobacteria bacterium]